MIQQLTIEHATGVLSIIEKATAVMQRQGVDQWDDIYPNIEIISQDLQAATGFGYFESSSLAGYIVINEISSPEYDQIKWMQNDKPFLVIHRLCVDPDFQNRGIGKNLIGFAEHLANIKNYDSIRLDAFSKNPISLKLYDQLGYRRVGAVEFRKGTFVCFEKILPVRR